MTVHTRREFVYRRWFSPALTLLAAIATCAPVMADTGAERVSVRRDGDTYVVQASFEVREAPATVRAVLTDYEGIPRYVPHVVRSVVRERSDSRLLVEQEAVSRFMLFSRRIHLLLRVEEDAHAIRFRDTSGASFERYDGSWHLSRRHDRTVVVYTLHALPAFDVPGFVLTRLLRRDAQDMIERLRAEMTSRSVSIR